MPKSGSEAQWQRTVTDFADLCGWNWRHETDSRKSKPGWPDLHMIRGCRVVYAELKTQRGRLTEAQKDYAQMLAPIAAGDNAVEYYVWVLPRDWDSGEIEMLLR